jgi:hypothetical protein
MKCTNAGCENDARSEGRRPGKYCSNACKQESYRNRHKALRYENTRKKILYFSGIEKKATAHVLVQEKASGMISQLLYNPALLTACADIDLVMDSGAYTKELGRQDIESYAALIIKLGLRCTWYAMPDVIGSQEKSNENYRFLLSLLLTILRKIFASLTSKFPVTTAQRTEQADFLTYHFPHNVFTNPTFVFEGEWSP